MQTGSCETARPRFVWAATVLGVSFILAALIAGDVVLQTKVSGTTIRVKGYASQPIVSDFGVWSGQVTARAVQLKDAYALIETAAARVGAFLTERNVPAGGVEWSPVAIETRYRRNAQGSETSEVESYVLCQSLTVSLPDVKTIERLARESSALVKEGVEFASYSPAYHYTRLDDMKIEMLGQATRDARRRAEAIAANGGIRVEKLRAAQQGVFQITPVHSTDTTDYGMLDSSSIEKTIKAIVDAEFNVK